MDFMPSSIRGEADSHECETNASSFVEFHEFCECMRINTYSELEFPRVHLYIDIDIWQLKMVWF